MDYKKELKKKISAGYKQRVRQWMSSVIDMAEDIVATQLVYENLLDTISDEDAAFLLRYDDDPLKVVSGRWSSENGLDAVHDDELIHCMESLRLEDMEQSHQMRVREFISQHPGVAFSMMTPGGYVLLTADQAEGLLKGESVVGYSGVTGSDRAVTADELLQQVIQDISWRNGVWYLMTKYPEMRQETSEMEVTMC